MHGIDGNLYELNGEKVTIKLSTYERGRLAVLVRCADGAPYATASVNIPQEGVDTDEFFCKNWSENEGMDKWLVDNGIAEHTGISVKRGFVDVPLMRLLKG